MKYRANILEMESENTGPSLISAIYFTWTKSEGYAQWSIKGLLKETKQLGPILKKKAPRKSYSNIRASDLTLSVEI